MEKIDSLGEVGKAYHGKRGRGELDLSGERYRWETQEDKSRKSDT